MIHPTKIILVILIAFSFQVFVSCNSSSNKVITVSVQTFDKDISNHEVQLVDVRDASEYEEGHLANAININVQAPGFIETANAKLSKKRPVYVYCRSGRRSLVAAELLSKEGYEVVNMDGGILSWEKHGFPVVSGKE